MNNKSAQLEPPGAHQIAAYIAAIPPGRVRTFFAPDVVDALARMDSAPDPAEQTPLMAVSWPMGTDIGAAIEFLVQALAGLALARWPDWYGESAPFSQSDVGTGTEADRDAPAIDRVGATKPTLNRVWVRQAVRRCRTGEKPTLRQFTPAIQLQQLALALAQPELVLLLAWEVADATSEELHCFARVAAWFAGETGLRVAAFVPEVYRSASELDPISYGAIYLAPPSSPDYGPVAPRALKSSAAAQIRRKSEIIDEILPTVGGNAVQWRAPSLRRDEPLRLVVPPILGRPHPASPGEQLLAQWLARDAELGPLFEFNQRVEISSGTSFIVDLLWREGKLTVEVDGYGWHSSPHAFAADRHRDYRLLCDGYRTLRLPHDEVMDDPALQCEKIRDVVRTIRKEN